MIFSEVQKLLLVRVQDCFDSELFLFEKPFPEILLLEPTDDRQTIQRKGILGGHFQSPRTR